MASTPDDIATAFCQVLQPGGTMNSQGVMIGGTPVGGVGVFVKRTADAPYAGPTPIVLIRPAQNVHGRAVAAGGLTLGKVDRGYVEVVYRDASLAQQQVANAGLTLADIENAATVARNAIVATLDANNTLGGEVTIAAESTEEVYNPDGMYETWQGAEWIGWAFRTDYQGELPS